MAWFSQKQAIQQKRTTNFSGCNKYTKTWFKSNCLPRQEEYSATTKIWELEANVCKDQRNLLQHHDQELVETASFVVLVVNATPDSTSQIYHTNHTDHCDEYKHFVCEQLKTELYPNRLTYIATRLEGCFRKLEEPEGIAWEPWWGHLLRNSCET